MDDTHIKGKDKNRLLAELVGTAFPGSAVHEQQKMAIFVRCTEDLEMIIKSLREQIESSSEKTSALNQRIAGLTLILALATAVGAFATFWNAFLV